VVVIKDGSPLFEESEDKSLAAEVASLLLDAPEQAPTVDAALEVPRLALNFAGVTGLLLDNVAEAAPLSAEWGRRPGLSGEAVAGPPVVAMEDEAWPFNAQLGDRVLIEGRLGVISWNGLPEHNFAAVRWDDDGEESEPLPLGELLKVSEEAGHGLPLIC